NCGEAARSNPDHLPTILIGRAKAFWHRADHKSCTQLCCLLERRLLTGARYRLVLPSHSSTPRGATACPRSVSMNGHTATIIPLKLLTVILSAGPIRLFNLGPYRSADRLARVL